MMRKLIIDGNAVYEVDENCMLRRRIDQDENQKKEKNEQGKKEEQSPDSSSESGKRS